MNLSLKQYLDADWERLSIVCGWPPGRPRNWVSYLHPRFAPVALVRCARSAYAHRLHRLAKLFSLANFLVFKLEVPAFLDIGPGLVIPHPQGTVLGACKIGNNATIFHQVTLGASSADFGFNPSLRPVVGNDVTLSVGAKILGAVHLGDGCVVGANAVVITDVPAGAVAVGVPAKIKKEGERMSADEYGSSQ